MIERLTTIWRSQGPIGLARAVGRRIWRQRAGSTALCTDLVRGRNGLEIGGPSGIFSRTGILPLYPVVRELDNCNFGTTTLWEGRITAGLTFVFDHRRPPGRQYIAEATDLAPVATASYDFVLSSHTLEHIANPLRALREWIRVLRPEGVLVLIVPHKDGTFDHRRPVTPLAHILEDWDRGTTEADVTHLPEILARHDLTRDPQAGDRDSFRARCENNFENRGLHHHVFDTRLVVDLIDYVGLQILGVEPVWPFHIILIARKPSPGASTQNDPFKRAEYLRRSPFRIDRAR